VEGRKVTPGPALTAFAASACAKLNNSFEDDISHFLPDWVARKAGPIFAVVGRLPSEKTNMLMIDGLLKSAGVTAEDYSSAARAG
jgi:hypothetical protein